MAGSAVVGFHMDDLNKPRYCRLCDKNHSPEEHPEVPPRLKMQIEFEEYEEILKKIPLTITCRKQIKKNLAELRKTKNIPEEKITITTKRFLELSQAFHKENNSVFQYYHNEMACSVVSNAYSRIISKIIINCLENTPVTEGQSRVLLEIINWLKKL